MRPADLSSIDSALAVAYAGVDWAATPLGAPESWSSALRHAVDLCLHARYPATLLWGSDLVMIYNAAYAPLIGDKHPAALGRRTQDVFPEAWEQVEPLLTGVLRTGEAVYLEDLLIPLHRRGFLEDCYFSFSYSPVHDEAGQVVGIIDISAETTSRKVSMRRLQRFSELRGALAEVTRVADLGQVLTTVFADDEDLLDLGLRLPGSTALDDLPRALRTGSPTQGAVLVEQGSLGPVAWLPLPVATLADPGPAQGGDVTHVPLLVAHLNPRLPLDTAYEQFVVLVGETVGQAWDRLGLLEQERQVAASEHELSLTLQRTLLTRPASVPGVEVAVRYVAATPHTQVGGDWYDAFLTDDGGLALSVGDVAGHDLAAISMMAQVRSLLRGLAFRSAEDPGSVMALLDQMLLGLGLDTLASGLLARLSTPDGTQCRTLTWSNAGHLPPLLVGPDGSARYLEAAVQPLLGIVGLPGWTRARHSSRTGMAPGSTLVLCTDGLVERPGADLTDGLEWLRHAVVERRALSAEDLAAGLVDDLPPGLADDVAVMVVRTATSPLGPSATLQAAPPQQSRLAQSPP